MPKAKKGKKSMAVTASPLSANGQGASARASRAATRGSAPRTEPKTRYCKTCGKTMKGHPKGQCGANGRSALDARAAEVEEAVLAAHTDLVSRQIDAVVADTLEASDGAIDTETILNALAAAGLEIPAGKSLADYVPDVGSGDSDDEDDVSATPPPANAPGMNTSTGLQTGEAAAGAAVESGAGGDVMQVDITENGGNTENVGNAGNVGGAENGGNGENGGSAGNGVQPQLVQVQVKTVKKRIKHPLSNGWRSTRGGDIPLNLDGNGLRRLEYPTQAEKAKRTPRMFQAMAQKGDTLASRTGGYAICMFVPRGGTGVMRTWHSDRVEADVPQLVPEIRRKVFDELQPFRQQYINSIAEENKALMQDRDLWKARAEEEGKENVRLRKELDGYKLRTT
ncbi:hypothetical protein AURDEDRAFT_170278 [Auricularia subglabra TFB-10046 SS5]|nr:hypothetical protein AURDEDRAFT_170278 [Auricularia subglabra TFB-10046 SS5]